VLNCLRCVVVVRFVDIDGFSVDHYYLVLCVCFVDRCLSFLCFFFWPLCCLFFFDIQILIASLISSNSS
jgi:hypothetical protein